MADDIRNPADTSKPNYRSNDWYEPQVQEGWTCQKGTGCPPLITSDLVYGHDEDPYTAMYYDDPDDPDVVPPVVTVDLAGEQDVDDAYIDSVTVTITAEDPVSGVDTIEYKVNAGSWTPYTVPVDISVAGAYTLYYRATDNSENTSAEASVEFTVVDSGG